MTLKTPDYVVTYGETPLYLTAGKRYPLNDDFDDGMYSILDDEGVPIIVLARGCAHLAGNKWTKGYRSRV